MPSTNFQVNKEKLKRTFATYGTPRRLESDNGPPFNSKEFQEFAAQEGFQHHRITPNHPRANSEAEIKDGDCQMVSVCAILNHHRIFNNINPMLMI